MHCVVARLSQLPGGVGSRCTTGRGSRACIRSATASRVARVSTLRSTLDASIAATAGTLPGCSGVDSSILGTVTVSNVPGADYQSNIALRLAKPLKRKPADVATQVVQSVSTRGFAEMSVSGPGFINIKVDDAELVRRLEHVAEHGVTCRSSNGKKVLVDFGSPNMAKALHVGHLRSMVVGDTLSRFYEHMGFAVDRFSHVGDAGVPVAVVIGELLQMPAVDVLSMSIDTLTKTYANAKKRYDDAANAEFRAVVQRVLNALHHPAAGDPRILQLWQDICTVSRNSWGPLMRRLGVFVQEKGESNYVSELADVVQELLASGVAAESRGAIVCFPNGPDSTPFMIRKSDGTYLYATTDLVALRRRLRGAPYHTCVYVTDTSQSGHFQQLFKIGSMAGWNPAIDGTRLIHADLGMVLGADGTKLSTRAGADLTLEDWLNQATDEARKIMREGDLATNSARSDADVAQTAAALGAGAVRYFDLSHQRKSNYAFSFEHALSFKGNTSVYLQYAVARLQSIHRKLTNTDAATATVSDVTPSAFQAEQAAAIDLWRPLFQPSSHTFDAVERDLALAVVRLEEAVEDAVGAASPHVLAEHMFRTARAFHVFYEHGRVAGDARQAIRIKLCAATDATIRAGCHLLGIPVVNRM